MTKPETQKQPVRDNSNRPANPAFIAYDAKRTAIEKRIETIRSQMDAAKNGYSLGSDQNMSEKNKKLRADLIEKVKSLRGHLKTLEDDRRALSAQFAETLETLKKKNADANAAKEKLSFKNVAEIDRRIQEIEKTLDSGRFTLSEEKQMLQEKSKLLKSRKALEALDGTGSDTNSLRLRLDQIKLRQSDLDASITTKRDEIGIISKQIDEINGVRAVEVAKRQDSRAELDRLRRELDAEYAKKQAAWEEYLESKAAREAAYLRSVARREEQTRCEAIETEIDELEKKLGRLSTDGAIDKKWNECTALINFFTPYLPKAAVETTGGESTNAKIRQAPALDLSKVEVIRKSEDCYYVPTKQRKGPKNSASTSTALPELNKLPFHILAALTDMSLSLPTNVETDIPALLETLNQRRCDLKSRRDASLAEADNHRNEILAQIAACRARIESKDEQITASVIKKQAKEAVNEVELEAEAEIEEN